MPDFYNFSVQGVPPTNVYMEMLSSQSSGNKGALSSVNYDGRWLRVESIRNNITRQPVVISLPRGLRSNPVDAMPQGYMIDFGSMTENVTISGTCLDGDHPAIANYAWLCQVARTGWFSTKASITKDTFSVAGGVRIGILECGENQTDYGFGSEVNHFATSEQWYQGVISTFNASRDGGQLKWDWQLTLTVGAWPIDKGNYRTMYRTTEATS